MKLPLLAAMLSLSTSATTPIYVALTEHDALGNTRQATALVNNFQYQCANGSCVLAVDYSTDQLFCSAFGP